MSRTETPRYKISRRRILRLGCASLGSTTLFSSLVHLGGISAAAAQNVAAGDDYRALVCVLLAGGNDSFNMLLPTTSGEYSDYQNVRADLALPREQLLPLRARDTGGRSYGLHPGMGELQRLFDRGEAAFVANVGTLVEPVTLAQFEAGTAKTPLGLYSHADQIEQWQTSLPDRRAATGWGGRLADAMASLNADQRVSMSISLGGTNVFQSGEQTAEFSLGPEGPEGLWGYGEDNPFEQLRTAATNSMLNATYKNLFERTYVERMKSALAGNELFRQALAAAPPLTTTFSKASLSASLRMVARTISARQALGARRQTFFVLVGGWDHHDEVLSKQQRMLPMVSRGLGEFQAALAELGVEQQVTTFTISDFGRTLTSNGRGSDHGWGGHQIVMGGTVRGGRIYGKYPRLFAGNPLDTGRGRLIPTLSVDEYFAELALWFGTGSAALDQILPNITRFYSPGSGRPPVGFLG